MSGVNLASLPVGKSGKVVKLTSTDKARRRMLDLGLIAGTPVTAVCKSPSGDPTAYQIRGAVIALRSEEAATILIEYSGQS